MENAALIVLLESILGKGQSTSKGNYAFNCPKCFNKSFFKVFNLELITESA